MIAPKSPFVDADPVVEREGNTADAVVAWYGGSAGVSGAGHAIEGPPGTLRLRSGQALGDPIVSVLRKPVGEPGDQTPGPSWGVLHRWRERNKEHGMVPLGEETSLPGWTVGSRSDP